MNGSSVRWRWTAPATSTPGVSSPRRWRGGEQHRQVGWQRLVRPGQRDDGGVDALAVDGAGNLYAGGYFTIAGGVAANHIAKWDGSAWSALGSGMGGLWGHSPGGGRRGNVYAGGSFTTAGGMAANNIAKWNGSTWSALGSGMDDIGRCPGSGRRRQPLRWGLVHHRWRCGGEQHRQVGWQCLVCPGQRDWICRSAPWRWTAPATSTPGATSPPLAGWRN